MVNAESVWQEFNRIGRLENEFEEYISNSESEISED